MDSSEPKLEIPRAVQTAQEKLAATVTALLEGAAVTPKEMLLLIGSVRHVRAELETLEQVLQNMGQKK
jgi:hypothetical protein